MIRTLEKCPEIDNIQKPYRMEIGEDGKMKYIPTKETLPDNTEHELEYDVLAETDEERKLLH